MNLVDPTGLSCTETQNGDYDCKIDIVSQDGNKKLTKEQKQFIAKFNKEYTKAFNNLIKERKNVTVGQNEFDKVGDSGFDISGSEVAINLIETKVTYEVGKTYGDALMTMAGDDRTGTQLRIYETARSIERPGDLQEHIVHEGIHGTRSERMGNPLYIIQGQSPYSDGHQKPYNDAARRLLGK